MVKFHFYFLVYYIMEFINSPLPGTYIFNMFRLFSILEITGYVNYVSQEREGKRGKFFECQFKIGENQYKKCYVWSPEKRKDFIDIQNKKRAICLKGIRLRKFGKNEDEDFIFDESSSYGETVNPSFEADVQTIDELREMSIKSLHKVPKDQLVSLKAKVVAVYDVKLSAAFRFPIKKQELEIADPTATIKMVLWGEYCDYGVKKNSSYIFKNFRLKRKFGRTFINSPKNSSSTSIEETTDFVEKVKEAKGITVTFVQDNVKITEIESTRSICSECKGKLDLENENLAWCKQCNKLIKINLLDSNRYFVITCNGANNSYKLDVFTPGLKKLLPNIDITLIEEKQLQKLILGLDTTKITYDIDSNTLVDAEIQ